MSNLKQTGHVERRKSEIDVFERVTGGVQMCRLPKQVNGRQRASVHGQVVPGTHHRHLARSGNSSK